MSDTESKLPEIVQTVEDAILLYRAIMTPDIKAKVALLKRLSDFIESNRTPKPATPNPASELTSCERPLQYPQSER